MNSRSVTVRLAVVFLLFTGAPMAAAQVATLPARPPAPPPPTVAITDALAAVRARFAPDRRLTVFDLTAETQDGRVVVRGEVESSEARDAVVAALRASGVVSVVDEITVLPAEAIGAETRGIIRVSVANVRGKPAHAAEMVTQAVMGWPVRVLKEQGGWYFVHTEPDGYLGWIEDLQLARMSPDRAGEWDAARRAIVTVAVTSARETPSADAVPVSDLVIGALLKLATSDGAWWGVELADGRKGYVRAEEVQEFGTWQASRALAADAIERTAKQFMGVPYLWGGTSSKGFDCSGFAKTVFRMNGLELPRDTDQQAQQGVAVPLDNGFDQLRKGDLLFFGAKASAERGERITHVGIYVGGMDFIHASGLVRRNSLDPLSPIYSESLRNRLLRARRVIPALPPPSQQ